jgi:hypothetical protein
VKREELLWWQELREKGEIERRVCSPEREGEKHLVAAGEEIAGEGWSPAREETARDRERQWPERGNRAWPRARAGERFFKNRIWAHRTVYSACPVHTGQRTGERGSGALAAGAPDSAQCSVRCTPDCPVSPDRGKI